MAADHPVPAIREQSRPDDDRAFRTLVEATPDAVVLIDAMNTMRYVNAALLRQFGYEAHELIGQPLALLQPERLRGAHREAMQRYRSRRARTVNWEAFETTAQRRDGTEFPAELSLVELTLDGAPHFGGFIRDITRRKDVKRRLLEAEARLGGILRAMRDVVWSVTPQGQPLFINPAAEELTGYTLDELRHSGRLWFDVTHPDDRAIAATFPTRLREQGELDVQYRIIRRDGAIRHIHVQGRAILDESGQVTRLDGTVRDVTEAKQSQDRILRLSRTQAVLGAINALTVRERNRQKLFEGACHIACEQGQLRMAWVGLVGPDGGIQPVASHGMDADYLRTIADLYLPANRRHSGPSARAVAEKRSIVVNDMASDATLEAARAAAAERGLHGVAALPLLTGGAVSAVICLYAREPGFFDEEQVSLLEQLAADLSYALEFIEREEQLRYASSFDALTGLANRRLFLDRLAQFVNQCCDRQRKLGVLVLDLVKFKSINDTLGHVAADDVLKQAADRLMRFAGNAAYVGRVGGDRFGAILPDIEDATALTRLLKDKVWERLGRPFTVEGHEIQPSARVGVALYPDDGPDAATVFRNAEAAVKRAKETAERFLFYTADMTTAIRERLTLETQMRQAIDQQQFVLHYQPKVDLRTGQVCGAEALMRWCSPKNGLVPPLRFVPVLEESGLITEAGAWALRQAASDRARWLAQHLPAVCVGINVSPQQLRQPDLVEIVAQALGADGDSVTGLEIEVTESMLMTDVEQSIAKLKRLRDRGVPTAIDDFGTGYSSLAYLARLPVNSVKIDRSFIVTMAENPDTMAIVSAIIALAHSMNLKVVAEGVETLEQLKFLRLLKCDEMQGFLFSPALPADAFAELLRSGRKLE